MPSQGKSRAPGAVWPAKIAADFLRGRPFLNPAVRLGEGYVRHAPLRSATFGGHKNRRKSMQQLALHLETFYVRGMVQNNLFLGNSAQLQ
jgi:hypothetical protein